MMKFLKKAPMAAGVAMALASGGAQANFSGIDLNLTANAAAGGMAGAAYTRPEEPTAAIFGNPATLTQFKGFNVNFGAAIARVNATNKQEFAGLVNKSISDADNYVAPNFGITMELAKGFVIGLGFEADGGLGADYRDDPIMLAAGALGTELPLIVEFLSFNANLAAAYEVTEKLSVGVSGTIGFGLLQFGTAGPTKGFATIPVLGSDAGGPLADFGGTSASVHDIGFGASLGATYEVTDQIMVSAAVKSKLEYNFRKLTHTVYEPNDGGWQKAKLQAPMEIIVGVAFDDVFLPNLLVEADLVWKNWDDAALVQDIWEDQLMLALGARYKMDNWIFRLGYQWSEPQQTPHTDRDNIADFVGVGTLPMGSTGSAVGAEVMGIIQTTLTPVIIEHTITAGVGYNFTDAVRVDAYASYGFPEEESRYTPVINGAIGGFPATKFTADVSIHIFGVGINVAMP